MGDRYQLAKADGTPDFLPGSESFKDEWDKAFDQLSPHRGQRFTIKEGHNPEGTPRKLEEIPSHLKPRLDSTPLDTVFRVRSVKDNFTILFRKHNVGISVYADPFRHASYNEARIDAGVDYCGSGPIYPIGRARIINRGKPSGTSVFGSDMPVYQLLDGPGKWLHVFCDEHLVLLPGYKTGDIVDVNTPLYNMTGCIEIGWSDGIGSYVWNKTNYNEGELSATGKSMNDLLVALGAKPGLALGRPVVGTLMPGLPSRWT